MAETAREVAAGTFAPQCAGVADLHPESLLRATDSALDAFEDEVRALREPSDEAVFGTVERVVLALNAIDGDGQHGDAGFCTEEREQLCEYIDRTLSRHGVDVAVLAARRGIGRSEITDRWRDW
jgi:nucleotide-binding universal stress UspA family protein